MQYKYRYILTVLLVAGMFCSHAQAGDLGLYVSEDAFQLDYSRDIKLMKEMDPQKLSLGIFFDEDRDIILNAGIMATDLLKGKLPIPLSFYFGAKAYLALLTQPVNEDVFALAPGAGIRFDIPIDIGMPMYIDADLYYAPTILTFGDADKLMDFTTQFVVDFHPQATGFIGYRHLRFDREISGGG
jgi:hypothetical protein